MIDLGTSVFRVLRKNAAVGAAFMVADQLLVTCAHVVQSAGVEVGQTVILAISDERKIEVSIVPEFWRDSIAEDIAILRLDKTLEGVQQLILGSSSGTRGHTFSTFGFPNHSHEIAGRGEIIGIATINGVKFLQLRSPEITRGFSGAPVFDEVTKRVIGVVASITPPDRYRRMGITAFAIPSETIRSICPELQILDICPYRSLDVFTEDDEEFFHGREGFINKMLESLKQEPRFLAMLGPSGSGKSSVVRAGLIPELKRGAVPGSEKWGMIIIRATENPFQQLADAGLLDLQAGLKFSVTTWLKNNPEKTRLVIIIDQFEETLFSTLDDKSKNFFQELENQLSGSSLKNSRVTFLIILRDAFYSQLHVASGLLSWIERGLVNIPPNLELDELRTIILEPAQKVGLTFDEGLVETIIQDTINSSHLSNMARSTILPLLEFALTQLWQKRSDGQLIYDAYREIGGVTGSLTRWANQTYDEFENLNQAFLSRRVLSDLVRLAHPETGMPDTRRRVSVINLSHDLTELKEVQNIVTILSNARLVITRRDHQEHETVELIHDSLLTEWRLLRNWLDEDRNFLIWKQKVEERCYDWKGQRGELLYGRDLELAEKYLTIYEDRLSKELVSFINESKTRLISSISHEDGLHLLRQLETAQEISQTIGLGLDLEHTIDAILKTLRDLFDQTDLCVLLYRSDERSLKFAPATLRYYKIQNPAYRRQDTFSLNERAIACRVARRALETRSLILENVADVMSDPDYLPLNNKILSELCVSLMSTKNELLGVLVLERDKVNGFSEAEQDLVKTVAQYLSVAIERAKQSEELTFRSIIAAQTAWAADIAHDINNEVGQIRTWAYLMKDQLEPGSALQEYAMKIEESAARLSSTGPWSDQPHEMVELDPFLERHLTNLALRRNLHAEFHLAASGVHIQVNPMELQHVLRQLVRNAARAMKNARIKKLVISTQLSDENIVEMLFQDSGPGIKKDVRLSIFQSPITTKGRGGYGLLLVRQMIEDMHGQIKLGPDRKGRGAVFSIRFPVASLID